MADSKPPASDEFHPTIWTLVHQAGDASNPGHDAALAQLLNTYRPALRSHLVRRLRIPEPRADDLLQEFILKKILQYNLVSRADKSRGKFRTLLLTALDNFARSKRSSTFAQEPEDAPQIADPHLTPDEAFDAQWARQVIQEALRRMETECRQSARLDLWDIFQTRVVAPAMDGASKSGYEQLVTQHALKSASKASNLLITAKRMFERNLKAAVAQYAGDDDLDEEITDLRKILARH